jgi:cyclopentanol dehydrogenase
MGRVDGKVVLISGAARGIGAVAATLMANEGARVVLGDIRDEAGQAVADQIERSGGTASFVHLDVTDESNWQAAVDLAFSRYGRLSVLVNNAGTFLLQGVVDTTRDEWERIMAINLTGPFLGTRAAIPLMRKSGGGSIVNISSAAGIVGNPFGAAYSASKGGVRLLTKCTALEFASENIRCNSVHPGPTDTELARETYGQRPQAFSDRGGPSRVPLGRMGRPEEIANVIVFLASDESSFMTGSEVVVDGGRTAQ